MAQETALSKAMDGKELSDRQTKGALSEALDKLGREGGKLSKLKENMGNLGDALIYAGETQGTVFVASFAEGYLGEEKMDIGPVDLRLAGGIASAGYGIYNVMTGKGGIVETTAGTAQATGGAAQLDTIGFTDQAVFTPTLNYTDGNLDVVRTMLTHPHTVPGLSDGGAHVGTICDVSFPTTLLQWWGRDRPRDRIPLKPGKHSVTFVTNSKRLSFDVVIRAGEEYKLVRNLNED